MSYIVVGLGNPGAKYERTRHNAGRLASAVVAKLESSKLKVMVPDTFMNNTGSFVAKKVGKKNAKNLIVIYDDLDLPLGSLKISYNRSSGGHKGLESVIGALGTREFIRIRIGIGKKGNPEEYVLKNFSKKEEEVLGKVLERAAEAVKKIVEAGLAPAMNEFNSQSPIK